MPGLPRYPDDPLRQRQHRGIPETVHLDDADLAVHQGGGHQERLSKLRLNYLGGMPLRRTTLELVGVTGRIGFDRHRRNILSPLDLQLCTCGQCGIDRGVQRPAARVWLVA